MTQILGIDISNARCHSHMKANLMDPETEAHLNEKRAALKAAKEEARAAGIPPDTVEAVTALKAEIDDINEGVVRIGGDAPIAMATIGDYVAKAMIKYAMDQTIIAERKMVEVSALHSGDLSELGVWTLIRNLPSITSYEPETEENLRRERAAANKAAKEAREAAKKAREAGDTPPAAGATRDDDESEDGERHGVTTTFNTYVDNVTKAVKSEEAYKAMRVSNRLREVVSSVVAELVASLSRVAKVAVLDLLQVRTLTAGHLKSMVKTLYVHHLGVDEGPGMQGLLAHVDEKLGLYHAHLETEKTRKWEQMDPSRKEDIEARRVIAEEERKKSRAASARQKAIDAALYAKKLAAEAS